MARPLDANTASAITQTVTSPHWFVRLGFSTPMRLTTAPTVTWAAEGGLFTNAPLDVVVAPRPTISIYNELLSLGVTVLTEGTAGRPVAIWQAYPDATATSSLPGYAEPVLLFEGEMGDAAIEDTVTIQCRRTAPLYSPRTYVGAPTFNHLPRSGTVIEMPQQKIVLD